MKIKNKNTANADIRNAATESGLFLWQVAARMGISAGTLTMWLRKEVTPEQRALIMRAIKGSSGNGKKKEVDSTHI